MRMIKEGFKYKKSVLSAIICAALTTGSITNAIAADKSSPPNIVVIMTDDVAPMDISAIHRGLGAVKTPNIDRIAKEGLTINDYYAQPSSTAGRAAFITGQYPIRTGLTSVGQPGSKIGLQDEDVTLAQLLKARGYATALFGKSHLGDRNEFLPTVHGFDEFYGFLYHLNMMEMPEQQGFPADPNFSGRPRNMLHTFATDVDDATVDKRWGKVGKQKIEDVGSLTSEHMGTVDNEFTKMSIDWVKKQHAAGKPFFLYYNPTRMHQQIHVSKEWLGKSGHGTYSDALLQLDSLVGELLNSLDEQGLTKNTIVLFTSDNGVNLAHWPMSGTPSFRGEKGLTWDGGFRVPMLIRWPGKIRTNDWSDQFMTSEDWLPTLMAAVGEPDVKEQLLKGMDVGGKTFKDHIDGYNQMDMLTKADGKSHRREFFFFGETQLNAVRVDNWKIHIATKDSWFGATTKIPGGLLIDIKLDPFERTPEVPGHFQWETEKSWILPLISGPVVDFMKSMKEFPPRQKGSGVGVQEALSNMKPSSKND